MRIMELNYVSECMLLQMYNTNTLIHGNQKIEATSKNNDAWQSTYLTGIEKL